MEPNWVDLNLADTQDYISKHYSAGKWAAGGLTFPLVPGTETNLLSWIMDRDSDNQGKWASALIDLKRVVKKFTDTKVRTAEFTIAKGGHCSVALDVVALLIESGSAESPDFNTGAPYIYQETDVKIGVAGGAVASDSDVESITISIDNGLEDPSEGMRLRNSYAPYQLYNLSGMRVTGSVDVDFVNNGLYADFLAGTESAITLILTRGCDVCTFTLPRIRWDADNAASPGTKDSRIVEGLTFTALGSATGATPPLSIT